MDESLIEDLAELDRVVKFSYAIVFCALIIFQNDDVFDFLVPDWEVDSC